VQHAQPDRVQLVTRSQWLGDQVAAVLALFSARCGGQVDLEVPVVQHVV